MVQRRHCDICDDDHADSVFFPIRMSPDGAGSSSEDGPHMDLCQDHLRGALEAFLRRRDYMATREVLDWLKSAKAGYPRSD